MKTNRTNQKFPWKRAAVAFLAALMIFAISGCGSKQEDNSDPNYYSGKDFGGKSATPGTAAGKKANE